MSTGFLIVLEGIDGAGTSTQASRLAKTLRDHGHQCHITREPSDGPIGKLLRQVLEKQLPAMGATTMSLLFAADRADHIEREVEPALKRGEVVISDRWYHSSLAYQGTDEQRQWILELNRAARRPDLTMFLRVRPQIAAQRRHRDNRNQELYESSAMQEQVAAGYEATIALLSDTETIVAIDGEKPMDDVTKQLLLHVQDQMQASPQRTCPS